MGGAVPPLPPYAFMAWCSGWGSTGTTLPLLLPYNFYLVFFVWIQILAVQLRDDYQYVGVGNAILISEALEQCISISK
jgi:hypothetical protein